MPEEFLDIVNKYGEVTGSASRDDIHHNNNLLHSVVHLLVFNSEGRLLLQKRSMSKDIAPGKWDTSVGGHISQGEDIYTALGRETKEELSLTGYDAGFLYSYIHTDERESELVYSFRCIYDGKIEFDPTEISEVRFWDMQKITEIIDTDIFSDNFRDEFRRYLEFA
ncbi:MAG TPA: NUDIX domain-containing protein [Nitrospirae bacterium]|nr:NUDIX domain-containing protein [Nitrospirota bacterium]